MEGFELFQTDAYEIISLEIKDSGLKSLPFWIIYPRIEAET